MTTDDRDRLIRLAIAPAPEVAAPADLGDLIYRSIVATPQRRRPLISTGRFFWPPTPSPALIAAFLLALLGLVVILIALGRQPVSHPLTMYHGGPDRTGVMDGPAPSGDPVVAWDVPRPGGLSFATMPLVVGGRVIVGDQSGILAALDEATGHVVWEVDVGSSILGSPALAGDLVVAGSEGGDVVAVRALDGRPAWTRHVGGAVSASLLTIHGVIYAGSADGTLSAIDARTGTVAWSVALGGPITRGPALAGGSLYVGAKGGHFVAIDVASHAVRAARELGDGEVGTPTVDRERVYVGRGLLAPDGPHDLVAMSSSSLAIQWSFAGPGGQQVHMGGLADGRVLAVCEDGNVYALDAATGELLWTAATDGSIGTLVAIVGEVVFVTSSDRSLRALDAPTGDQLWRLDVIGSPTMPAVSGGRVFVGTNVGRVVAISGS